jgi:myo-inositol-1(or 4)-monophosphatase
LRTSKTPVLEEALLASGFPGDMRGWEHTLAWWEYFASRVRSLRRTGSTALNLAYLAAGRFDGFWAFDNKPWDVAAGVVLVREAGGTITNLDGTAFDPFTLDALATNGPLHPSMVEHLRGACVPPFRPLR